MKPIHSYLIASWLFQALLPLAGNTVAYWRFEEGPVDGNVARGGLGDGVFYPGVADASGNGNGLSAWSDGGGAGYAYRIDKTGPLVPGTGAANSFSVQNTGGYPAMWTETGTALQTWSPAAWTIEVAFQPELTDSYRTLVGRDSRGTATVNGDLAALYFQIQPNESLAIKFCDVSGYWHEAVSAANLVQGFVFPNTAAGQWQAAAAVCDGATLSLYYRNVETNGAWQLVAQTNLTASGSPNTALTAGAGDGGDWDAGNWSVGRGLYAGGHGDRAVGFIDEVRLSDSALSQAEFLFTPNAADSDSDGLADAWEQFYFQDLDETGTGDPDGDTYSNEAEETGGSDPTKTASTPLDLDGDGLADAWETANFGGIGAADGTGDPDGDLATNEQEETAGSNPNDFRSWPDADSDQMNDAWETKFLGGTGASNGTPDTDGDGFPDLEEFKANTNPAAAAFSPAFAQGRHRWSFTNNLNDSIGSSNAQILPGGSAYPAVLGATSVQLAGGPKGQADYVLLGNHLLRGLATPVTIELWATQNTVQNWSRIFDFHASTAQKLFMSWTRGADINLDRVEWGGAANPVADDTNAPYSLLTPFHIAMVIEPGKGANGTTRVSWYSAPAGSPDLGAAQGSFDTVNNLVNLDDLNDALGLSPYPDNTPSASYDEVRIWNGALRSWALEGLHDRGPDNPSQPDADADGLPDDWESVNSLSTASGTGNDGPAGDPDGDLTDNRHELLYGTDPQNPASNAQDTDADGLADAWEITHFGNIAAQNATGDPDGDLAYNDEEFAAGSDPNSAASFPDSEPDGLCDGWEFYYFGDLAAQTGTGDPDGDGLDNVAEQTAKSSPNDPLSPGATDGDGDNDGLDDRWEVTHFGNLTSQGATGNPDGDSADNLAEYLGLSDPNVPASTPADVNGDGTPDTALVLGFGATATGVLDKDGEAIGFTQRLANTGTDPAFLPNDPNLDLDTAAGTLAITSTTADVNGQVGMAVAEMLGIPLSSLGFTGGQDFKVRAKYVNLPAFTNADQLGLFAGASSTALIRGGRINAQNSFGTNTNGNNDADGVFGGDFAHLAATRSATVELSRTAGVWALSINGVTVTPAVQPAFLDALGNLTVGVFVSDVQSAGVHKTAYLDNFTVVVMGAGTNDKDGDGMDDAWETAKLGGTGQGAADNPDGDKASNLEEFAFNGNPTNGADQGHVATTRVDSNANGRAELTLTIAARAGATFAAGPNGTRTATVGGITYTVRGAEDLQAWTSPVTWLGSAPSGDPDYELHTFRLEVSDAAPPAAKGFLQAVVTAP